MTLPTDDTRVDYPKGTTTMTASISHLAPLPDGRVAVLLDSTCFHPVDAAWPDQGADRGVLRVGNDTIPVVNAIVAATNGFELYLGAAVPVRKGDDGWAFVVAHIVEDVGALSDGTTVEIVVDADHRRALSIGHTACHLASLALNAALTERWSKEVRLDGLGHPDFDGLAIDSSRITEYGSIDQFRLNKSLRRKGFATDGLGDALASVEQRVNTLLAEWIAVGSPVRIEREGERLTDRRYWTCVCAGETVRIACGGTHAAALCELDATRVALTVADKQGTPVLTMVTTIASDSPA